MQNLAPGAAARAGLDSEALRRANPRLVTMDISGYGETGAKANYKVWCLFGPRPAAMPPDCFDLNPGVVWRVCVCAHTQAYDLLVQAESGLATVSGRPGAPTRVGVSVCDVICGLNAHGAILQALVDRARTGEGQGLKTSLFMGAAELMAVPFLQQRETGTAPTNIGLAHPVIAPYGTFPTADGHLVLLGVQNEREWAHLCEGVLGDGPLAKDPRFCRPDLRVANRAALDAIVSAATQKLPREAVLAKLFASGVACAAISSVADLVAHPQLSTVQYRTSTGHLATVPAPPVTSSLHAHRAPPMPDVPAVGQHSAAIRAEFAEKK